MFMAAEAGSLHIVRLLADHGASTTTPEHESKRRPRDIAFISEWRCISSIAYKRSHGAIVQFFDAIHAFESQRPLLAGTMRSGWQ